MLRVVADDKTAAELGSGLDEIVREGARRMLAAALEAEVEAYVSGLADEVDEHGKRLVVRNGHAEPRHIQTGAGAVEVVAPRVNDRRVDEATGERRRFRSSIIPPWARKSPKVAEVLPLMYLHGMSSKDFAPALEEFFGSSAGLSASVVTRLTTQWQDEAERFSRRSLADRDYVYVWADGVHFNVRLDEHRLCALVIVGVRTDGTKELVSITDGIRESTESWADVLRDLRRRGMRAPTVAVGDGALGFWAALRDVFPETVEARCPSLPSRRPARPWRRSATPRTATTPSLRSGCSSGTTGPSGRRRSRRSSMTPRCSSASSTTPQSTGFISRPRTRSSRPSQQSDSGRR
jgi:putative transposase